MIGTRFRLARIHKGLTLKEVGTVMGVSPQAVAQWEKTNPQFTMAKTNMLSNILAVNFEWLDGTKGSDNEIIFMTEHDDVFFTIPVVNKLEALSFSIYAHSRGEKEDFKKGLIVPTAKIIGRGFAFEMDDDSMYPLICRDDILVFDPAVRPKNEDIVFAVTYEMGGMINPVIRTYKHIGEDDQGNFKIELNSANDSFPSYILNEGSIGQVFAVLVELRMLRPRGWQHPP